MKRRRGFTLIELLVVIAIIGALVALLLPAVQKVRAAAQRAHCSNNLKQIALAAHGYHDAFSSLPPGSTLSPSQASTLALLLPYLEQDNLYRQFDFSTSAAYGPVNSGPRAQPVAVFLCPSDPSVGYSQDPTPPYEIPGKSNYFGNMGSHAWWKDENGPTQVKDPGLCGLFTLNSRTRLTDITDGTSNTVLFAEVKRGAKPSHDQLGVTVLMPAVWDNAPYNPGTNPANLAPLPACENPTSTLEDTGLVYCQGFLNMAFYTHTVPPNYRGRDCIRGFNYDQGHLASRSYHPAGVNVAFADGSLHFIRDTIAPDTWKALGTRSGGESPEAGDY